MRPRARMRFGRMMSRFRREKVVRPAAALLCLFVMLGFAGKQLKTLPERTGFSFQGAAGWIERRTAFAIWESWYPAAVSLQSGERQQQEKGISDRLSEFILRQVPYYRMSTADAKAGTDWIINEVDPAYRGYLESGKLLKEYECLVRDLESSSVLSGERGVSSGHAALAGAQGNVAAGSGNGVSGDQLLLSAGSIAGETLLNKSGRSMEGVRYVSEQLADYDFLMKHFYTVHSTTTAGRDIMSAETFLSKDLTLKEGADKPQILIYHTHSQEEFSDYHTGNKEATIVGVGTYLTELLQQKGYNVIHDTSVYDLKDGKLDRSSAYTYALDGITAILQKYPSIQVVLDVHRDGVREDTHLVKDINGKRTAMIMFFNGTSQTPDGPIEYLPNPYRTDNMAFSFQMKLCADACYPGYTRKIYLKGLRYNEHVRPRSSLIEVGAQNNTYEEARNAMEPLAEILDMVLRPAG